VLETLSEIKCAVKLIDRTKIRLLVRKSKQT